MPRNLGTVADPVDTTPGLTVNITRNGPGALGVQIDVAYGADPPPEIFTGQDFTAGERATLKAAVDLCIAKFKTRKGYT